MMGSQQEPDPIDPGNLRIFTRVGENGLAGNRAWSRRQQAHEPRVVQGQDLSVVQISSRTMSHTQSPRSGRARRQIHSPLTLAQLFRQFRRPEHPHRLSEIPGNWNFYRLLP
jgi:hypothetical protein